MNLIGLYGPCRVSQGHSAIGGASATPTPRGIVYRPDLRLVVSNCKQVDQTGRLPVLTVLKIGGDVRLMHVYCSGGIQRKA